jgi:1-acyl-sn-glycerol-3-phosphate acyltransferase
MLRFPRRALETAYGACALAVFVVLFLLATLLALVLPGVDLRRRTTSILARLALILFGLRITTLGLARIPEGSAVVVANHASYLDGFVLKAVLPPRFSFVVKREAAALPVAGLLLRRIGSEFVDRSSRGGRQRGARRVIERAEQGQSLVFFPEGTFDAIPGLKPFHVGAFTAAVRGAMPLVPVVIRGARRALPPGAFLPRPGRIEVEILEPLAVASPGMTPDRLRDESRRQMLARINEPDLAAGVP